MEFAQQAITLEENAVITKNYDEKIIVPKGKVLLIEGMINRLIICNEGTVIVKGTCYRINCIFGKIIVEKNGFVNSLYAINGDLEINGTVYEIVTRENAKCKLNQNSVCKNIINQDSDFTICENVIIDNYIQFGTDAKLSRNANSIIRNQEYNNFLFY